MRVALEPAGASHVAVAEEYSMWQSQRRHQGNRDRTPVGEVQARGCGTVEASRASRGESKERLKLNLAVRSYFVGLNA